MPKSLESWSLVISIIAIGISILIWFISHKINQARRNDEKTEQNSAALKGHLEKKPGRLVIENVGNSEARNVIIKVDGLTVKDSPSVGVFETQEYVIGPHSRMELPVTINVETPVPKKIDILWDDNHATGKTYRNSLSY